MKNYLCSLLLLAIAVHSLVVMGNEKGNGGNVIDLRTYYDRALSEKDLEELLQNNGLKLKEGLIIPMIRYVVPSMIDDPIAQSNFALMTADRGMLERDITYSLFEFGTCEPGHDACVETNTPFSKIIFDKQSLLAKYSSLGDIGGLVIHEYEHKYGHPEHTKYALGKFFKERIEAKKHIGQVYSINPNEVRSGIALSIWGGLFQNNRILLTPKNEVQESSDRYCQKRGYFSALNFQTINIPPRAGAFDMFKVEVDMYGNLKAANYNSQGYDFSRDWYEIAKVTCIY